MSCGKEHKKRKCPSCGSMAVKVGWENYKILLYFWYYCNSNNWTSINY
jgi:hypothetical protein